MRPFVPSAWRALRVRGLLLGNGRVDLHAAHGQSAVQSAAEADRTKLRVHER